MIEVTGIFRYPLTGAAAESLEVSNVLPSGLEHDRHLVLYDSSVEGKVKPRVSQKQLPRLACYGAFAHDETTELYLPNYGNFFVDESSVGEPVMVEEFGDATPCFDLGDQFANRFSSQLGRPALRLAIKSLDWIAGRVVPVADRACQPMHLVSMPTVRVLQARQPQSNFGAERFRANVWADGDIEPFAENDWVGKTIVINGEEYMVSRPTERCPVPGYDQRTGVNRKDVPKLYRELPKSDEKKPIVGVYLYRVARGQSVGDAQTHPQIALGQELELAS